MGALLYVAASVWLVIVFFEQWGLPESAGVSAFIFASSSGWDGEVVNTSIR